LPCPTTFATGLAFASMPESDTRKPFYDAL